MHRIPKMFSNSSNRRKTSADSGSRSGGSSSSGKQKPRPRPRLDRLNAVKNFNYEFSPSSTSDSPSSSHYSSEESLRTRSLDYDGRSSFRVDGVDGDIEILCKSLGFSGIDDFEIPAEEFEAMKARSSSAPVMFSQAIKPLLDRQIEVNYDEDAQFSDEISREIMENDKYVGFSGNSSDVIRNKCEESRSNVFGSRLEDYDRSRVNEIRGNGIKGTRPPVLAPPPLMTLPVIDKECSTWDMFRSFAPDSETNNSRFELGFCLDKDEEGPEEGGWERNGNGSYSFTTTSNDDDSSSSTTEAMSSISPNGRFRRVITDWQKGELLGRGSFGSVYEGIADGGFFFAVKEVSLLDKGEDGKQRIIQLEQEIALLSQFEHENIVRYYGAKKDESNLYIFLELVTKGSLLSLYQKYTLRDSVVSAYTRQILHGLKYLHDRNVVHRDIKCANILVDTNGLVKLADFGLAKATKLNDVKSCKGTAFWMAPEVVRSLGYGLAADIWSLGCTVLEMLTRRFPYSDFECMAALFRIGKGERPTIPDSLSSDAQDFILKCLQVDPSLRPSAAQLLDHPFVKRPLPPSSPHYFARKI